MKSSYAKYVAICLSLASLTASGQSSGQSSAKATQPNVLLILSDDHGLDLGCYGDEFARTPRLDWLASEGVRFERAYTTQASCSPARAAILTGLYPHQNGQMGLTQANYRLRDGVVTIPSALRQAGYFTGAIGKVHVAPEEQVGFDWRGVPPKRTRYMDEVRAGFAEFLEARAGRPFFMMLNYSEPHRPSVQDIERTGKSHYQQVAGLPEVVQQADEVEAFPFLGMDSDRLRQDAAGYYNSIARMDTGIGMILDDLKARNLLEDTVVIYTSDQGPGFTRAKTTCYEAGLRVPLIIRMPGGEPAEVWPGMVSLVDLAPTIFDLVGVTAPPGLAGRSLAGLLRGGTLAERKHLFSEYNAHGYGQSYLRRAVRGERYKLIHNLQTERPNPIQGIVGCAAWEESRRPALAGTIVRAAFDRYAHPPEFELYDLWADPWEFNNLAGKPKFADVQAELQSVLAEWRKQTNDPGEIER